MQSILTTQRREVVHSTGASIPDGISFDDWADIGRDIGRASTAFQLAVGDWLVYGQEHFEGCPAFLGMERKAGRVSTVFMDYACELTRIDRSVLSDYAYVARKVPCSLRNEQLTYNHYRVLAKLPEDEQKEWIDLAVEKKTRVPSRLLAKSIALSTQENEKPRIWAKSEIVERAMAGAGSLIDAPEPILDRFIRSMRRQSFEEWTPAMKAHLWKKFRSAQQLMQEMGAE